MRKEMACRAGLALPCISGTPALWDQLLVRMHRQGHSGHVCVQAGRQNLYSDRPTWLFLLELPVIHPASLSTAHGGMARDTPSPTSCGERLCDLVLPDVQVPVTSHRCALPIPAQITFGAGTKRAPSEGSLRRVVAPFLSQFVQFTPYLTHEGAVLIRRSDLQKLFCSFTDKDLTFDPQTFTYFFQQDHPAHR